jgi:hypothetical protein
MNTFDKCTMSKSHAGSSQAKDRYVSETMSDSCSNSGWRVGWRGKHTEFLEELFQMILSAAVC